MADSGKNGSATQDMGLRVRMRGEERRILSQHERLDDLCRDVYVRIDKHGAVLAINDFLLFMTALDAHMTVGEDIYFPALHGLRSDVGSDLSALVTEHEELREAANSIRVQLKRNDAEGARLALDELARRISAHELVEEELIARITGGPITEYARSGLDE